MFGLFDSLVNVAVDVADVVTAPVKVCVDVAATVTKPVANVANEIVHEVRESLRD